MMENENNEFGSGGYISHNPMFRSLTALEVDEFRQHARENYLPGSKINEVWHPVYRYECLKMADEAKGQNIERQRE